MSQSLESVLRLYRENLPPGELQNFRIDPNDHLGIPVVDATFVPAGQHRRYNGVGYGADETRAQIGAFGELYEFMHLTEAFRAMPTEEASYREMQHRKGTDHVIDPLTLVLPAGSPYTPDTPLRWTEVRRLTDDAPAWVLSEFVANSNTDVAYDHQLTTAITNGNGAGDTRERALLHGLLELLQRDGNCDSFRALDQGKVIGVDDIAPRTREMMDTLDRRGLRVIPKLARETCGCISVYAVGQDHSNDPFPMSVTACGEGADPDFDRAMYKAVLECASSHSRKLFYHCSFERKAKTAPPGYVEENVALIHLENEEERALRAMVGWLSLSREELYQRLADTVFSQQEVVSATHFPRFASDDVGERLRHVRQGIEAEGMDIYYFAALPADHPIQVTKVIVPGIEMELGSYHRLGARGVQRLLDRSDELISQRSGPGKQRVRLTAEQEAQLGGAFWLDTEKLDRKVDPLYPLYREATGHSAAYAYETDYFASKVRSS